MNESFQTWNGDRPDAADVVVIISDGAANTDRQLTVPYAVEARNNGIYIVTLAVGTLADDVMLRSVASPPTDRSVFHAVRGFDLMDFRDRLFLASCDGLRMHPALYELPSVVWPCSRAKFRGIFRTAQSLSYPFPSSLPYPFLLLPPSSTFCSSPYLSK